MPISAQGGCSYITVSSTTVWIEERASHPMAGNDKMCLGCTQPPTGKERTLTFLPLPVYVAPQGHLAEHYFFHFRGHHPSFLALKHFLGAEIRGRLIPTCVTFWAHDLGCESLGPHSGLLAWLWEGGVCVQWCRCVLPRLILISAYLCKFQRAECTSVPSDANSPGENARPLQMRILSANGFR